MRSILKCLSINLVFLYMLSGCSRAATPTTSERRLPSRTKEKILVYEDKIYEDQIRTVLFYPTSTADTAVLTPPIMNRLEGMPLTLSFDDLGGKYCNYYFKLYHCNANWTRSNYTDLQIVSDFNETLITDYSTSINTKVRYMHYSFMVPRVRLTGNFVLMVYRNGDQSDMVITRRFVVYDPLVDVITNVQYSTDVKDRDTKQQVDFVIQYSNAFDIPNPQDVRVVVRQNYRWDNAIAINQPMYIKSEKQQLDYTFFDGSNRFEGGNEFRFFDIRNFRVKGMNMIKIVTSDTNNVIDLAVDKNRQSRTYSEQIDIDGRYVIQKYESTDPGTEADYANVVFNLKVAPDFEGDIYLTGQLTNWNLTPKYKLDYDTASGMYGTIQLLKQGFYNYQYCLVQRNNSIDWNYFEGSFSMTENLYDIIVYYRPPNQFNDIVIGYTNYNYRGRGTK